MTKKYLFLLCTLLTAFSGCSKDNDETTQKENKDNNVTVTDPDVKRWIREKMETYYLWNDKMPAENTINKTLSVGDYFEKLVYRANKSVHRWEDIYGDRFSHLENLETATRGQQASNKDFGGKITVISYSKTEMVAQFMYVSPDSPLAAGGKIRRGTMFNKVNGIQLRPGNYNELLNGQSLSISNDSKYGPLLKPTTISQDSYPGTPILYNAILSIDGHRVGYLVYNQFKRGPDDDNFANTAFEDELKAVFHRFKADRIDKLVLDLRYNPGGYLVTANLLASLIAPEAALGKTLAYHRFNSTIEKSPKLKREMGGSEDFFFTKKEVPDNLNMADVCIITTGSTASASEYVLNCLKPYMNVIHVGEKTVGKNQSAISFKRDPEKDWEISPIISYVENSRHEGSYEAGINPQFASHDYKMVQENGQWYIDDLKLYEFGDYRNEIMLREALTRLGLNVPKALITRSAEESVRIPASNIIKFQEKDKGLIRITE